MGSGLTTIEVRAWVSNYTSQKLEQLERLRSEDTPRRLMRIPPAVKFLNFETGITRDTPSEVAW